MARPSTSSTYSLETYLKSYGLTTDDGEVSSYAKPVAAWDTPDEGGGSSSLDEATRIRNNLAQLEAQLGHLDAPKQAREPLQALDINMRLQTAESGKAAWRTSPMKNMHGDSAPNLRPVPKLSPVRSTGGSSLSALLEDLERLKVKHGHLLHGSLLHAGPGASMSSMGRHGTAPHQQSQVLFLSQHAPRPQTSMPSLLQYAPGRNSSSTLGQLHSHAQHLPPSMAPAPWGSTSSHLARSASAQRPATITMSTGVQASVRTVSTSTQTDESSFAVKGSPAPVQTLTQTQTVLQTSQHEGHALRHLSKLRSEPMEAADIHVQDELPACDSLAYLIAHGQSVEAQPAGETHQPSRQYSSTLGTAPARALSSLAHTHVALRQHAAPAVQPAQAVQAGDLQQSVLSALMQLLSDPPSELQEQLQPVAAVRSMRTSSANGVWSSGGAAAPTAGIPPSPTTEPAWSAQVACRPHTAQKQASHDAPAQNTSAVAAVQALYEPSIQGVPHSSAAARAGPSSSGEPPVDPKHSSRAEPAAAVGTAWHRSSSNGSMAPASLDATSDLLPPLLAKRLQACLWLCRS